MTRILIIEDEESYREALTYMLNKDSTLPPRLMAKAAWPSTTAMARTWFCWI